GRSRETLSYPLDVAVISLTSIRGTLSSLNQLLIVVGILLASVVNYALAPWEAWRWMIGLAVVPAAALFIGMLFMPETPRWLASRNWMDEAERVLRTIRGPEELEESRAEIREAHRRTREEGRWRDLTAKSIRPALDRKSTRLNSSHVKISYAVFCLKKK